MRKLISIVSPVFNEEDNVEDCYRAVKAVFDGPLSGYDYEHVFSDNCSTDRTAALLRSLAEIDPRVKVIFNARNFGPFCSNFNALMSTAGDGVLVFLPADLQDPPELLPEFVARWEAGYEVVHGIRAHREESRVMRAVRKAYYRLVSRMANINIPIDVSEFQFVDRAVIDALRQYDDYYPYIRGMIANCGFKTTGVKFTWKARKKGLSKNRLYHLIDQGLNGLISFTNLPMRLTMFGGLIIAFFSIAYAIVAFCVNLVFFRRFAAPGIATLTVAVFFFGGVQLFAFGVLGEYVAAIHAQVRKRPLVVERDRLNFGRQPKAPHAGLPAEPHRLHPGDG
jgi:glycosyltransferase involved in cell wall biosynthesis